MIKILKYGEAQVSEILSKPDLSADVEKPVAEILQNVREKGDEALFAYTERFDGVRLSALEVTGEEMDKAFDEVSGEFLNILREAAGNIRFFHEKQVRNGFMTSEREGIILGQKIIPIAKVGIYVPGGTAAYPSTVLMDAIPAKIAGCGEIVMVTPPGKDGNIKPEILAAARIAGVDSVFRIGGAQAIGALAFGTQSVPKVDKIVGPGNAFVTEANLGNGRQLDSENPSHLSMYVLLPHSTRKASGSFETGNGRPPFAVMSSAALSIRTLSSS